MVLSILPGTAVATDGGVTLNVSVTQVGESTGNVIIALFDTEKGFPHGAAAIGSLKVTAKKGTVASAFKKLAPGRYAVAAFHDANGNDALDTTFLGIPTEEYGFSRNARCATGPPEFSAAAFDLNGSASVSIRLD
jgi:uncharacterized protein (DUF2141 family)